MAAAPLAAQIDPTGHWRTLETAHFRVHARAEHHDVAVLAAGEAELAWSRYVALLPAPRGRIDLVVADNTDEANGYASTYPGNRVVIYAMPPVGDLELHSYDRWLRLVITHELGHIFHLDLARGWWGLGRRVLGRAPFLFPNEYSPNWLREGVAVFYESQLTDAGRLEGAYHRAIVAAEAAEGGGLPLDEASTPSPKWPGGLRWDAFGSTFMGYGARLGGDSAIARLATRSARQALPYLQLSGSWKGATGRSLGAAWRDWQREERDSATARPESAGPAVVSRLRLALAPRLSPDGSQLLLVHNDGRDPTRLLILDRRTGAQRRIGRFFGVTGASWTPDGDLVLSQLEYGDLYTLRSDLWRVSVRTGAARRLTRGARLREPDVGPNGTIVATRVLPGTTNLVDLPADSPYFKLRGDAWATVPSRGPDQPGFDYAQARYDSSGTRLAALREVEGWHDIVVFTRRGLVPVTWDSVPDLDPVFTRDGRWLLWSREVQGIPQIVGVPADSAFDFGRAAQFTHEPFGAWAPEPAGDSLYYLSYHADGFRLAVVPLTPVPFQLAPPASTGGRVSFAPHTPVRDEHDYHALHSLLPRYWLPQAFVEPGNSAWWGAFTSGNDVLERHEYTATLMLGAGLLAGQWQGSLGYAHAGPGHAILDAYARHQPELVDTSSTATPAIACCVPDDELHLGVSFVRRRWRSQLLVRSGVEYTNGTRQRVGGSLTASYGNTISAPLGISPQYGGRITTFVRYRHRLYQERSAVEYTVRGTLYRAFDTGQFARQVLAVRGAAGSSSGNDRPAYSVGGVSSSSVPVLPGVNLGGSARTFPVRGYPPSWLSGRHAVAASLEHRIPLALVARGLGLVPVGLDRLSAIAFVDAGAAWAARYCPTLPPAPPPGVRAPITKPCPEWIASAGAEVVADLGLGYSYPLRLRVGAAARLESGLFPSAYFAFGSSF